eukprot:g5357.t1
MEAKRSISSSTVSFARTTFCERRAVVLFAWILFIGVSVGLTLTLWPTDLVQNIALDLNSTAGTCTARHGKKISSACKDASNLAGTYSLYSNSALAFLAAFLSPILGALSDKTGRAPFLIFSGTLSTLAMVFQTMYLQSKGRQLWLILYYTLSALSGSGGWVISIALGHLSDVYSQDKSQRAAGFAVLLAFFEVATMFTPKIGVLLSSSKPLLPFIVSCMFTGLSTLLLFALPESRSVEREKKKGDSGSILHHLNYFEQMKILKKSKLFLWLSVIVLLSASQGAASSAVQQYVYDGVFAMTPKSIANLYLASGILGFCLSSFLVQPLVACMGTARMLRLGLFLTLSSSCVMLLSVWLLQKSMITVEQGQWFVWVQSGLSTASLLVYPATSSLKANACDDGEQGRAQGALFGVRSLANCLSPLVFSFVFSAGNPLKMYVISTLFAVVAFLVSFKISTDYDRVTSSSESKEKLLEPMVI